MFLLFSEKKKLISSNFYNERYYSFMQMNPFHNPLFLLKMVKSYLFDIERLRNFNEEELKRYQDKQLKKMVQYAYTVPLYHEKYKKVGVHPTGIVGIKDIAKLPTISKEDIKQYYPNGIVSPHAPRYRLIEVSTSGTTGKSLALYGDLFDVVLWLFWYIRILNEWRINWRKDRLTIIGDFAPNTIGSGYIHRGLLSNINSDLFFRNIQWLNTNDEPEKMINEVDRFKPDFIGGYAGMLGHLALLKDQGFGKNINPTYVGTIGSVLTGPLRKLVETTFHASVFEVYGATESGTIAKKKKKGHYHIMSDLVYPEFLKDGQHVTSREPGKLIITKLYGHGTPFIRYDAVNDIVAPIYEPCDCDYPGIRIDRIYGRDDLALLFSGGRALLPSSISEIHGRLLYELKTNKVKQTRIIQHDLHTVEIQLAIDPKLRNIGPSVDEIFSVLQKGYRDKIGLGVDITIKEVKKVSKKEPRIVTKVDKNSFKIKKYV